MTSAHGIEFNYDLSGGSITMLGTYNFAILRMIFADEPEVCLTCDTRTLGDGIHDKCDYDFKAKFRFPNGGIGEAITSLRRSIFWKPSEARVIHKEVIVPETALPATQEKVMTRVVTLHGFLYAIIWHRIDIEDSYVIRNKAGGQPVKKWVESRSYKAYSFKKAGGNFSNLPGENWWMSYRYGLEAFVNRIKGRPTQYWVTREDSINQMKMVDMAYEKSGLGLRPTNLFR